jgi:Flp pilus assembly protein TadD
MERLPGAAVAIVLATTALLGCRLVPHVDARPLLPPSDERPSDEPLYLAKLHFRNGDYGLAEEYYRRAVEANRDSFDAWLGLAATYDRLRRFDLAENAYRTLVAKIGYTPVVLNNLGYHYLLAGKPTEARTYLMQAYQKDPENPQVLSNLALLDQWSTAPGGAKR